MKKYILSIGLIVLMFTGCGYHQPVPENYKGKTSFIDDTFKQNSNSQSDFFYLKEYNHKLIENAHYKTLDENYGRGFYMSPSYHTRKIPAKTAKFKIVGRSVYGAPILEISNKIFFIEKEFEFTPKANVVYKVKGILGEDYSAVWLEEENTGKVIVKSEIKGSTELSFWEK